MSPGTHGLRLRAVDVGEALHGSELSCYQDLSASFEDVRVRRKRGDGAADELRRLRVREVDVVLPPQDPLGADEAWIERDDGDPVLAKLACHQEREPVCC